MTNIKHLVVLLFVLTSSFAMGQQQTVELCPDSRTIFTYYSSVNSQDGRWTWIFNQDTVSHSNNTTIHWIDTGYFKIKVLYRGECGDDTKEYLVHVINCIQSAIFFYNAFTPNRDGLNDTWGPICIKIKEVHYDIYNRWGEKVYHSDNQFKKWDGKYKGMAADLGNYVFYATWVHQDGRTGHTKGNLLLIR